MTIADITERTNNLGDAWDKFKRENGVRLKALETHNSPASICRSAYEKYHTDNNWLVPVENDHCHTWQLWKAAWKIAQGVNDV